MTILVSLIVIKLTSSKRKPEPKENTPEDVEMLRAAKRRYEETEKAFQEMMNFTAEQAYGSNITEE